MPCVMNISTLNSRFNIGPFKEIWIRIRQLQRVRIVSYQTRSSDRCYGFLFQKKTHLDKCLLILLEFHDPAIKAYNYNTYVSL
ncbi:hypothetical protein K1719_015014 [Acacia pycnantha]|nr:hypothetical protein K1719_015014 [Acacia pycnantha]